MINIIPGPIIAKIKAIIDEVRDGSQFFAKIPLNKNKLLLLYQE